MTGTPKPPKAGRLGAKLRQALGSIKKSPQPQMAAAGGPIKIRLVDSSAASEAAAPAADKEYANVNVLGMCN